MGAWILVVACVLFGLMLFAWIAVDVSAYFHEAARLRRLDAERDEWDRRRDAELRLRRRRA